MVIVRSSSEINGMSGLIVDSVAVSWILWPVHSRLRISASRAWSGSANAARTRAPGVVSWCISSSKFSTGCSLPLQGVLDAEVEGVDLGLEVDGREAPLFVVLGSAELEQRFASLRRAHADERTAGVVLDWDAGRGWLSGSTRG